MEHGEFHWTDGWFFKRLDGGDVQIRHRFDSEPVVVPAAQWVSIVTHVSADPTNYPKAERVHHGG